MYHHLPNHLPRLQKNICLLVQHGAPSRAVQGVFTGRAPTNHHPLNLLLNQLGSLCILGSPGNVSIEFFVSFGGSNIELTSRILASPALAPTPPSIEPILLVAGGSPG